MKKSFIIAALFVLTIAPCGVKGQSIVDNGLFYHSFRSPFSNRLNPALFPGQSGWYVTTAKTDVAVGLPLSYNDLGLEYDEVRDVTTLNLNNLIKNLKENGSNFVVNADMDILGFGFTVKDKLHFSASSGVKIDNSMAIPLGVLDLLTQGNVNPMGHVDFGADNILNSQAYFYASISGAMKLPKLPVTIGARFNLLDGIVAASVDNLSVDLKTSQDIHQMQLTSDYKLHLAGIPTLENLDDLGSLDFNNIVENLSFPKNLGFTFDIGAKAKVGILDLSLSIKDLGPGIHWTTNPITIVPKTQDVTITFDGVDMSTLLTNGKIDTSFLSNWKDSLMAMIDYTSESEDYWYSMPTHLYMGASATIAKFMRLGFLFQGLWQNGWFSNHHVDTPPFACNNTLSLHFNIFNWLELAAANSFTYDGNHFAFLNPGASVTVGLGGRFQLFASVEYLSSLYLTELKSAHVVFGINMVGLKK